MPKKLDQVAALSWDDKELTVMSASLQLFLDCRAKPFMRRRISVYPTASWAASSTELCERIPYVIRTISLRGRTEAAGHLAVR